MMAIVVVVVVVQQMTDVAAFLVDGRPILELEY